MKLLSNIWFKCPACQKKLVVDRSAGGMRADCPECGKKIPIPESSTACPNWVKTAGLAGAQFALIILALAIGWRLARHDSQQPMVSRGDHSPVQTISGPVTAEEDFRAVDDDQGNGVDLKLLEAHSDLQGRYDRLIEWMLENYRGRYPLPERLVNRLRISPLNDDGDVHPDLVEMLKINDQEKAMIRDVFEYVLGNFKAAEAERARITENQPDRITFMIPHYPEIGAELKEDMHLAVESTLGSARFDRMMDVAGAEMRETFHYYGEASRTLTFEIIRPKNPGDHPPYVLIRDGWVIPEGESMRLTKITETAVLNELPSAYEAYTSWLPETMLVPSVTP
ncbi:MAG TPA: hypothetical protein PJ991_05945 [Kiritimatiellia bacterium]|nr:hypothetical protein [Kiritimatiellia bacterium]